MNRQLQNKLLFEKQKVEAMPTALKSKNNQPMLIKIILTALFFLGTTLLIFEIDIYRKTIIDWKIPAGIWFFGGFLLLPFTIKHLVNYYGTSNIFLQLVFNICAFGGILVYCFMATNYYFRKDNQLEIIKTKILRTGHLAKGNYGCANSYADVIVKDCDKELIFPCGFEITEYKFVNLTITKGLLGFDIIMGKEPSTE